jgi:uncharacterized linocin/CFP29 family protein
MDILKRNLSPISDAAWEEIEEQARRVLRAKLSARKLVDFNGPLGWDYTAAPVGRLNISDTGKKNEVRYGVFDVQPLVESRVEFELNTWELDNVDRGAKDIDFSSLDEAAKKIANFEEKAVYQGLSDARISGLREAAEHEAVQLKTDSPGEILKGISEGVAKLSEASVEGPYALVCGPKEWSQLDTVSSEGYPLRSRIERLIGGEIIRSPGDYGNFLVSLRGGDMELTVGQDFSIGYVGHTGSTVTLYLTETFTFRVISPEVIVPYK